MGEIAEMVLDGTLCEGCGEFMGEGCGFRRLCAACDPAFEPAPMPKRRGPLPTGPVKLTAAQRELLLKAQASNGGGIAHWRFAQRDVNRLLKLGLLQPKTGISRHSAGNGITTYLYVPTAVDKKLAAELAKAQA